MKLKEFFEHAESSIVIAGTVPLIPDLERGAELFKNLLTLRKDLHLTILCESDSEVFNQSLCVDTDYSKVRLSHARLRVHRDRVLGKTDKDGLIAEVAELLSGRPLEQEKDPNQILERIQVKQVNLRLPLNFILADSELWCCVTGKSVPNIASYFPLSRETHPNLYEEILEFADFYTNPQKGAIYLSKPEEELIQMYDKDGYPRGIFPRACFYTTEFARYSIWGFVFNRNGELLLHQRGTSDNIRDGRGLWDKSIGGHVDLRDSSTFFTAQRELIEEMFMPEAEYSPYFQADLGDIIHFGQWNTLKRPERTFKGAFLGLSKADWVMFRATDEKGNPLTITRVSDRRIHDEDGNVSHRKTVFKSDVFLFIAPPKFIDVEEEMKNLLRVPEERGAAKAHKLITIEGLRKWISEVEEKQDSREVFTDDILHINLQMRGLLESFSEFVKYLR